MLMCMQLLGYLSLVISVRIGAKIGNIQVHHNMLAVSPSSPVECCCLTEGYKICYQHQYSIHISCHCLHRWQELTIRLSSEIA